jgi:hypothetical protein
MEPQSVRKPEDIIVEALDKFKDKSPIVAVLVTDYAANMLQFIEDCKVKKAPS